MNPFIKKLPIPLLLLLFVVLLQLVLNTDSYLYADTGHYDAAVFFRCGQSLMEGLTPYDHFADSKGLLLWVVYGIGWLISPHSYVGVFWMACLSFWAAFLIAWQSASLWLPRRSALLATMGMGVVYWYWNFYTECKAEHFCFPFMAWAVYVLLRQVRGRDVSALHYAGVGVAVGCVLMLKWSVAAMMVGLVGSIVLWAWQRRELLRCLGSAVAGLAVTLLPFLAFFLATDSLDDMWREYFVHTLASVSVPLSETLRVYGGELLDLFTTRRILYIIYILPLAFLWRRSQPFLSALPLLSALFVIALAVRHDRFGHYITSVAPFTIFALTFVVMLMQRHRRGLALYALGLVAGLAYILWGRLHYADTLFTHITPRTESFERLNWQIAHAGKAHPTLLFIGQDPGLGLGFARPYCRYWITQMGATPLMLREQEQSLREARADFVSLSSDSTIARHEPFLLRHGYRPLPTASGLKVYTRLNVPPVPATFRLTPTDILLKRDKTKEW